MERGRTCAQTRERDGDNRNEIVHSENTIYPYMRIEKRREQEKKNNETKREERKESGSAADAGPARGSLSIECPRGNLVSRKTCQDVQQTPTH